MLEFIKMVDRSDPKKFIDAVKFTGDNGQEISEYFRNLEYHEKTNVLSKDDSYVPWGSGRWVVCEEGSKTAHFNNEEFLLAAYAPVVEVVDHDPDPDFNAVAFKGELSPWQLQGSTNLDIPSANPDVDPVFLEANYADNVRFLNQPLPEPEYQDLSPMQARLLLNSIYGKKMPDGSLGSIEKIEPEEITEAELLNVNLWHFDLDYNMYKRYDEEGRVVEWKTPPGSDEWKSANQLNIEGVSPADYDMFATDSPEWKARVKTQQDILVQEMRQRLADQNGVPIEQIHVAHIDRPLELSQTNVEPGNTIVYYEPPFEPVINLSDLANIDTTQETHLSYETARALTGEAFPIPKVLDNFLTEPVSTESVVEGDEGWYRAPFASFNPTAPAYISALQESVCQFHEAFGHPAPKEITRMPYSRARLRSKMIRLELTEFDEASAKRDLVEQYDALLDILVLTVGGLVEMGADLVPGFEEVMRANMSKLGPDGKAIYSRGEEEDGEPKGKILKGPDYIAPDLFQVLIQQGFEPNKQEREMYIGDVSGA